MSPVTVHLRIEGRVQGVGYREWTSRQATELGLRGFVRNRRDGWVEAYFQGDQETITKITAECREGPHFAQVTKIDQLEALDLETDKFVILSTV